MGKDKKVPQRIEVSFTVQGVAVPKQSFRFSRYGNHQPEGVREWQATVSFAARRAWDGQPVSCPLAVSILFVLPDHRRRDLDNLSKGVLDALNGVLWKDDCQITILHLEKAFCKEKPHVEVDVINDDEVSSDLP